MTTTRKLEVPGADGAPVPSSDEPLNNVDDSLDSVAASRETAIAMRAAENAMKDGDPANAAAVLLAALAAIQTAAPAKAQAAERDGEIPIDMSAYGSDVIGFSVPLVTRSADVEMYGPELKYDSGTALNEKKLPCEGDDRQVYVVGNIKTTRGILVRRALRLQDAATGQASAVA